MRLFANKDLCDHSLVSDFVGDTDWFAEIVSKTRPNSNVVELGKLLEDNLFYDVSVENFQLLQGIGSSGVFVRAVKVADIALASTDAALATDRTDEQHVQAALDHFATWESAIAGEEQAVLAGYAPHMIPYTAQNGDVYYLDVVIIPFIKGSKVTSKEGMPMVGTNRGQQLLFEVEYDGWTDETLSHTIKRTTWGTHTWVPGTLDNSQPTAAMAVSQEFSLIGLLADDRERIITNVPTYARGAQPFENGWTDSLMDTVPLLTAPTNSLVQVTTMKRYDMQAMLTAWVDKWDETMDTVHSLATTLRSKADRRADVMKVASDLWAADIPVSEMQAAQARTGVIIPGASNVNAAVRTRAFATHAYDPQLFAYDADNFDLVIGRRDRLASYEAGAATNDLWLYELSVPSVIRTAAILGFNQESTTDDWMLHKQIGAGRDIHHGNVTAEVVSPPSSLVVIPDLSLEFSSDLTQLDELQADDAEREAEFTVVADELETRLEKTILDGFVPREDSSPEALYLVCRDVYAAF